MAHNVKDHTTDTSNDMPPAREMDQGDECLQVGAEAKPIITPTVEDKKGLLPEVQLCISVSDSGDASLSLTFCAQEEQGCIVEEEEQVGLDEIAMRLSVLNDCAFYPLLKDESADEELAARKGNPKKKKMPVNTALALDELHLNEVDNKGHSSQAPRMGMADLFSFSVAGLSLQEFQGLSSEQKDHLARTDQIRKDEV